MGHEIELDHFSIKGSVELCFNHNYMTAGSGLSHLRFRVGTPIPLGDHMILTPTIEAYIGLSEDIGVPSGINWNASLTFPDMTR